MMRRRKHLPVPSWLAQFLSMLPTIRSHAALAFRHLNSGASEDAIQEAIANAMLIYARLVQLKKVDLAYPTVLARCAVAQVKRPTVPAMMNCSLVCHNPICSPSNLSQKPVGERRSAGIRSRLKNAAAVLG